MTEQVHSLYNLSRQTENMGVIEKLDSKSIAGKYKNFTATEDTLGLQGNLSNNSNQGMNLHAKV